MSWLYTIFALAQNVVFSVLHVTTLSALAEIAAWVCGSDFILGYMVGTSCNLTYSTVINLYFTSSHFIFFTLPSHPSE